MEESTRFWAKVDKRDDGCWEWQASLAGGGYGSFVVQNRRRVPAHRYAYEALRGQIPAGLQIDHLCRNRKCVNPAHMEPVTQQENIRRGESGKHWAAKTQCPAGHAYEGHNILQTKNARGGAVRKCRMCTYARTEACRKARKARSA